MMSYVVVVAVYGYPWPPYLLVLLFIVGLLKELLAPLWGFLQVVLACLCVISELQVSDPSTHTGKRRNRVKGTAVASLMPPSNAMASLYFNFVRSTMSVRAFLKNLPQHSFKPQSAPAYAVNSVAKRCAFKALCFKGGVQKACHHLQP